MKMKSKCKEFIALTLSCVLTLTLASCGSAADPETAVQTESAAMTELSEQTEETVSDDIKTGEAEKEDKVETKEESEEVTETAGTGPACPSVNGKLQVIGTQLCDQNGDPVQLRGISTHGLAWFPEYVNQDCINELKSWGANLLRLAMYTAESGGYCTDGDKDQLKELVRSGVEYAANADMYVIVDWHVLSEGTPSVYQSEAEDFFDEMSEEFAGYDNVIYEICNEPNTADWPEIKAYAEKIISVIRANDPDAVIIVGTPTWSQDVDRAAADPITDQENIMYALHFYAATHKDDLRSRMTAAVDDGLPVFVTEYGICDASGSGELDIDSADEWISLMNEYGISYAAWNLSNKDESSAIFAPGVTKTSGFTREDLSESGKWVYDMLKNAADISPAELTGHEAGEDEQDSDADATETGDSSDSGAGIRMEDGLTVYADLDSSWNDGADVYSYLYRVTVDNTTGQDIDGWSVTLDFNEPFTLADSWNGSCTVSGSSLTIVNADYNGKLSENGSAQDIGFIIEGSSSLTMK